MGEENKAIEAVEQAVATPKTRRTFIKTASQVAMTAPAVALLLDASTKPASALVAVYNARLSQDGIPITAESFDDGGEDGIDADAPSDSPADFLGFPP